ncbi:hypothetical protein D1007_58310 [Hordeum vulgare]|nr:hypothetical protein D1007_58310 [Hordeum vulgare]
MEGSRPTGLWLRVDGYYNGPIWVAVDLSPSSARFLTRGWNLFVRSHVLCPEHILHFTFNGDATLSMRFFGSYDSRLKSCAKISRGSELDTSSVSNDIDNSPNARLEGDDSEYSRLRRGGIHKVPLHLGLAGQKLALHPRGIVFG